MQLSFGNAAGEFHKRPDIEGGVYLTDSLVSAAQFACYAVEGETPEKVEVLEFLWKGEGIAVYDFKTSDDPNYHKFLNYNGGLDDSFKKEAAKIYENAMITGYGHCARSEYVLNEGFHSPMIQNIPGGGDDLTDLFWQYAIVKQAAISHALEFKEHYSNIYCSSIPFGETLSARMYAEGQGGNPAFAKRLAKLQNPKYHPKSSKVVFQQQDAVL
ncbi:hypothetical protein B0H15DRAFT_931848 [Mycena belliarum]|uniref:RES domain-containing protein n=1 Tax=Mycena belliarum TaxID=1033014 RepID=A0AAD6XMJ5_9AGAR|nr:hypothetical protein B0H15DRAFT_931848 [Mycena belliae]